MKNAVIDESWLEKLTLEECLAFLRSDTVGRIAVVVDDFPVVVPVNYRFVETSGRQWVALRTRPGSIVEQGSRNVAFQVDGRDFAARRGWSVLVRGTLHRVDPDAADFRERFDPDPWITQDRDAWLIIEPCAISGRRLHSDRSQWAFNTRAYL